MVAFFPGAEGRTCGIPIQVAGGAPAPHQASRMAAAGCKVSFQDIGCELLHVDPGRRLPLVRKDRVFVPGGTDEILPGDAVVVFALPAARDEVLTLFRKPRV